MSGVVSLYVLIGAKRLANILLWSIASFSVDRKSVFALP